VCRKLERKPEGQLRERECENVGKRCKMDAPFKGGRTPKYKLV
jgi:hypothetical protein